MFGMKFLDTISKLEAHNCKRNFNVTHDNKGNPITYMYKCIQMILKLVLTKCQRVIWFCFTLLENLLKKNPWHFINQSTIKPKLIMTNYI